MSFPVVTQSRHRELRILDADTGQTNNPTAIAALEAVSADLVLRHLERLPSGTPYPKVVDRLHAFGDLFLSLVERAARGIDSAEKFPALASEV